MRLLFCLFADDTTIFEKGIFFDFLDQRTSEDGSDLARSLAELFEVLNTPGEKRLKKLDEQLAAFPYVNGKLFEERLPIASFDRKMRQTLLDCSALDWGKISPAIFGSLFQSVMDETARRNLGAHYTSEKNIMKLIKPLFLDALWDEFRRIESRPKMQAFHSMLRSLTFLDPACGCGNFLIIAYRELRLLELEVIKFLLKDKLKTKQALTDINIYFEVDVDQFYGIEYEEFPAQIAQVAMWLIDHQMNMVASETFGEYYVRLPLKKSATIVHGNALWVDWESLLPGKCFDYILGNPPFRGHHYQNELQKEDMARVFAGLQGFGVLDYVSAWYMLAGNYLANSNPSKAVNPTSCGFVSTSSIVQGEQLGILWKYLLQRFGLKIHFAHRTFKWSNEARSNAGVHVVIIGFSNFDVVAKTIYEYDDVQGEPHARSANNINPYLVDFKDLLMANRREPICNVPRMIWDNKPTDGGNFLFDDAEAKDAFLMKEPEAKRWIRPFVSGDDFLQSKYRFCLWLTEITPHELNGLPEIKKRVQAVKEMRLSSKAAATRAKANIPTLFAQVAQPTTGYLAIPEVSSERRKYIPIAFLTPDVIASNKIQMMPHATLWHFGILTSLMHMTWTKHVCGRLESRLSYSNTIVYNNFPWPDSPSEKNIKAVEAAAQKVLDARAAFPDSSLADLYDPLTMPAQLTKAHAALDKAVDVCYRPQAFPNDAKRMEFLFDLYDKYTAGIFAQPTKSKTKR